MARNIYTNKVASKRSLQTLSINSLMGVDYSSSMVNIRDYHAYDIKNFLKKNNVLRNRNGFEQIGKWKINGIWECNFKGRRIFVVHCGTKWYYVKSVEDLNTYDIQSSNYHEINTSIELADKPSWGVFANDRLYILCGKYCVLKFTIDDKTNNLVLTFVEVYNDEDTYIPTTTIGITFNNNNSGSQRQTLDDINMMTPYRYNTLSTLVGQDVGTGNRYYQLDGIVDSTNANEYQSYCGVEYIKISYLDDNGVKYSEELTPEADTEDEQDTNCHFYLNKEKVFTIYSSSGLLAAYKDFTPPNDLEDNVTVKFKVKSDDNKLIDNCTFGIVYGANGNRNRLFLSGNPDKPNVDYHSRRRNIYATGKDIDLEDSQDFTYFSVYDYCAYGTSNSAITDYQIMGNGDLMVLKEHNINESNIYFRSGGFDTDEQGYTIETYPTRVGNIGQGTIKGQKGTLKNLNNDIVFVGTLGVYGISSTISAGTLNSDYQYAYARSNLINSKLNAYINDLEAITATIHDNKYFCTLKLKNGSYKTFVADGRYAYKLEESIDNEYEYEWFVLDNINADKYFEIDNVLYFTNNNGFFKLDLNKEVKEHIDVYKIPVLSGDTNTTYNPEYDDMGYDYDEGNVSVSEMLLEKINDTSKFVLGTDNNYYVILTVNSTNGVVNIYNSSLSEVAKKRIRDYFNDETNEIYAYVSNEKLRVFPILQKDEYDIYDIKMSIEDEQNLTLTENKLYVKVSGKEFTFEIEKYDNGNISHINKIVDNYGNAVAITNENKEVSIELTGYITNTKIVDCLYVTKAFNMGQSLYNKNLKSVTVINDAESYSWVNFGIRTKTVKKRFDENIVSGTDGLVDTYQNIFKADLTDSSFATSFTKNYYLKFNFVQFEFYNDNGSDCIVNNINIIYTLGFKQGGVS